MEITYLGHSCVRLRGRDALVVIDPVQSTLPGTGRGAVDVVVRTEGAGDPAALRPREGAPQEVSGPGEYELCGVSILGLPAGPTTLMRVEVDDVKVVVVGGLLRQLTEEEIDQLGHVDVLVVPVGAGDGMDASQAIRLVRSVEPAVVVPVRYRGAAGGDRREPVERFTAEMGLAEGSWTVQPKLNLTGGSDTVDETRVVVLEVRG